PATRPPLRRAGDFVITQQHIVTDRIDKTCVGSFRRVACGKMRLAAFCNERVTNRAMQRGVDLRRPASEHRIIRRYYERISEVRAVQHAATPRPTPNEFARLRFDRDFCKLAEI